MNKPLIAYAVVDKKTQKIDPRDIYVLPQVAELVLGKDELLLTVEIYAKENTKSDRGDRRSNAGSTKRTTRKAKSK